MLQRTKKLGSGTYGIVYKAVTKDGKTEFAFKRNLSQTDGYSEVMRELDILNRLRGHPRVIAIMMVSVGNPFADDAMSPIKTGTKEVYTDDVFHFLFELAQCNLLEWIDKNYPSFQQLKQFMVDIMLGVEFISNSGIIHRDLKPANIVVFGPGIDPLTPSENVVNRESPVESGNHLSPNSPFDFDGLHRLKICDFGLAKPFVSGDMQTPGVATVWYRAPEIAGGSTDYDTKSDAWSVGCIIYEMIFKRPFVGKITDSTRELVNGIMRNALYEYSEYEIKEVMKFKGGVRPSVNPRTIKDRILSDQFIKSLITAHITPKTTTQIPFLVPSHEQVPKMESFQDTINGLDNVIGSLLVVDPKERASVTQALDSPFFDSHKEYIKQCREKYMPCFSLENYYDIRDCIERNWASVYIVSIFNNSKDYYWYSHRRLFHAIDIFDRTLRYFLRRAPTNSIETRESGKAFNQTNSELYFFSCLYISIKYFTTLHHRIDMIDLIPPHLAEYTGPQLKSYEISIIKDILEYKIYRHTLYESICGQGKNDKFEDRIRQGIIKLTTEFADINGKRPSDVARELI